MQLTQLDLCSGVGASFWVAGLRAGFKLVGVSEIDEYCSDILSKRFPDVCNYGDVRSLPVRDIRKQWGEIDVVTASPPCQPFSVQGKRQGEEDPRDCFPAVKRAIESIKPRFFCIENVSGLLNCPIRPGRTTLYLQHFLRQITRLGYDAEWLCVSSGAFGSPFIRERLLLVGVARGIIEWQRTTPWSEQARITIEKIKSLSTGVSSQPGIFRECLQSSTWLDRPTGKQIGIGVASGNGVIRSRRAALGNALDWRVAAVGLRRVAYLNSLCRESAATKA
ncbi:MAG: DNA cytosine methyltransferase [Nostoc sp.]